MTDKSTGAFDALLADLGATAEDLAKSQAASEDAGKIEAAAAEGADGDEGEGGEKKPDCDKDGKPMTKALVTNADGTTEEVLAIDADDLVKSLVARIEGSEAATHEVLGKVGDLMKSLAASVTALQGEVKALSQRGAGRRAVLTVHDKPDLTKSLAGGDAGEGGAGDAETAETTSGLNGKEFLAKALDAAAAGKISYRDANFCETLIGKGAQPPAEIVRAVLAA